MAALIVMLLGLFWQGGIPAAKPTIDYAVHVDSADLSGWWVELRVRNAPGSFRLAMAAHPEYDDRYWRYITDLTAESPAGPVTIARQDSAVWGVDGPAGEIAVRYRLRLPAPAQPLRAAWRPVRAANGAFLGGPHTFLYVLGAERAPVRVTLDLPRGWDVATGLAPAAGTTTTFIAPGAEALIDSPILAGRFRSWRFLVDGVAHRIVYWPLPDAAAFDTVRFVSGIEAMVRQAAALFGGMPYRDYTFVFQDGAYGGLEHANSVTLGAASRDLAEDVGGMLPETAHEFVHTWNLMQLRPAEYQALDYRTQPPTAGLWFSEGLTLFYADLLLRRAGLPVPDSTRVAHLERLMARYLGSPGHSRFSAEAVSRVAYNAAPGALGDYSASTHLQGELIGAVLDLIVRDATGGTRSMDDVMRAMLRRFTGERGFEGRDVEQVTEDVCRCDVTPLFDAHVRGAGRPMDFDRYLGLMGLRTRVTREPAVWDGQPERDLRIFAWEPPGEGGVRLVITDPASIWGRAGFHTGDPLIAADGIAFTTWADFRSRLRGLTLGDSITLEVRRPEGPYAATVVVTGFERPVVRIEVIPGATERQRALRAAWVRGLP
jgi:predicted metalloprotease with PDZ domain